MKVMMFNFLIIALFHSELQVPSGRSAKNQMRPEKQFLKGRGRGRKDWRTGRPLNEDRPINEMNRKTFLGFGMNARSGRPVRRLSQMKRGALSIGQGRPKHISNEDFMWGDDLMGTPEQFGADRSFPNSMPRFEQFSRQDEHFDRQEEPFPPRPMDHFDRPEERFQHFDHPNESYSRSALLNEPFDRQGEQFNRPVEHFDRHREQFDRPIEHFNAPSEHCESHMAPFNQPADAFHRGAEPFIRPTDGNLHHNSFQRGIPHHFPRPENPRFHRHPGPFDNRMPHFRSHNPERPEFFVYNESNDNSNGMWEANPQSGMPNSQSGMPNSQTGMPNMQSGMPNSQSGMPISQSMPNLHPADSHG